MKGSASLFKNSLIVITASIISRFLGLLRTSVFAHRFGTGEVLGAYNAAFGLVDAIYLLVIGGALGSSLIPVFTRYLAKDRERDAWQLVSTVLNFSLLAAMGFALLFYLTAPVLVPSIIMPGESPDQQAFTVQIIRILLIQPIILGLCGVSLAILNSFKRFLLTSIGPLIYNLSIIAGAAFFSSADDISGVLYGVILGAVLYFLVLLPGLISVGFKYKPSLNWRTPGFKQVMFLMLPRILGQAVFHINFIALRAFASFGGSFMITTLEYGYRLFNLPLGILGISIGTVAFPTLATYANQEAWDSYANTLRKVFRIILFFAIPIAFGLFSLRFPIIRLLYMRGQFDIQALHTTAMYLLFFAAGLPLACITEVAVRAFYALHDTKTPVLIGAVIVGVNIFLGFLISRGLPLYLLAGTFSLTNSLEAIALLFLLKKRLSLKKWAGLTATIVRALTAGALMAAVLSIGSSFFTASLPEMNGFLVIALILSFTAVGAGIYFIVQKLTGSPEISDALQMVRQKLKKK
ncbi:MAG: murein biosynthesis integral membrane protein MurJ [Spirochaetia bacterium]